VQAPSDSIALDRNWLVALALPATWTTAVLTFQGSNDTENRIASLHHLTEVAVLMPIVGVRCRLPHQSSPDTRKRQGQRFWQPTLPPDTACRQSSTSGRG
jgi:hypothetical protein